MTAYVALAADNTRWDGDLEASLSPALHAAGKAHLGMLGDQPLGAYQYAVHPPFDEANPPFELSAADRETHSLLALPSSLSFVHVENGWAYLHTPGEQQRFSASMQAYLRAYIQFFRARVPGARIGYVLHWDGDCESDPPLRAREHVSEEDFLTAVPEVRVIALVTV